MTAAWCADCREAKARRAKTGSTSAKPTKAARPRTATAAKGRPAAPASTRAEKARAAVRQHEAEIKKARKRGDAAAAKAATDRLRAAQQRLPAADPKPATIRDRGGTSSSGQRSADQLTEVSAGSLPPTLDPDLDSHDVWILPTGSAYHRADCHVLDGRAPARRVRSRAARGQGFKRCEHCSPLA